jgi:hypothetical protein
MRVSANNYRDATRLATGLVSVLYFIAGVLLAFSARRVALPPAIYMAGIMGVILACNLAVWGFQKILLPKAELRLRHAIDTNDADLFLTAILKRETARLAQPVGGLGLTIGILTAFIVLRALR